MKGFKLYIFVGSAIMLIYIVAQLNKPVPTNWEPSYLIKDKIPYGTLIFFNRLGDMVPKAKVSISTKDVYGTLKSNNSTNTTYLIVTPNLKIDTNDYAQIVGFVEKGNNVYLATKDPGPFLRQKLKLSYTYGNYFFADSNKHEVNFVNPLLKKEVNYAFNKNIGTIHFKKLDTSKAIVLGTLNSGEANFIKYPFKRGAIYLLSDPAFFSNYNLLEADGADYAAKAMSYINNSSTIIYDQYYSNGSASDKSLLRFIFKHTPLKYGYYLALIGFLFFLFYEIKRRQRVIPVADPFSNTTVAFVDVVSSVYLNQKDSRDIAEKKIIYFFDHLRSRYYWKVIEIDKDFAATLQQKSGISEALAYGLATQIKYIHSGTHVHDDILINLNNLIESFYKESK